MLFFEVFSYNPFYNCHLSQVAHYLHIIAQTNCPIPNPAPSRGADHVEFTDTKGNPTINTFPKNATTFKENFKVNMIQTKHQNKAVMDFNGKSLVLSSHQKHSIWSQLASSEPYLPQDSIPQFWQQYKHDPAAGETNQLSSIAKVDYRLLVSLYFLLNECALCIMCVRNQPCVLNEQTNLWRSMTP